MKSQFYKNKNNGNVDLFFLQFQNIFFNKT